MRRYIPIFFLVLFLSAHSLVIAQLAPSRYRVAFTDKTNTPHSVSAPLTFLSQKSIDRRTNQGIVLKDEDLPIDPAYTNAILGYGFELLNRSKWFNSITVYTQDSFLIDSIKLLPFVLGVDTLGKIKPPAETLQEKTSNSDKWSYETIGPANSITTATTNYGQGFSQIAMLGGDILHGIGYRGAGKTIAIIDAGFKNADTNPAFANLFSSGRVLGTWDFVDGNDAVYDNGQHGLWVFSIIASDISGTLVGVAPDASFYLLRTEDTNSEYLIEEDNWVSAAEYADSAGVDILSTSLGYKTFTDPSMDHTYSDMDGNTTRISIGADKAASKGMLVVNSAGNAGNSSWQYIVAPADGDSVLAVGSVDATETYSSFSSTGPSADGQVKPNVSAMGGGTTTITQSGGLQTGSGTSFAAPLISGMAACLWQAHPTASSMEIFNAIQQSAHQYTAPDDLLGYGIPNFMTAHYILAGVPATNDEDGDGVPDVSDQCLLTPFPAVVGLDGCPLNFEIDAFLEAMENPIDNSFSYLYYAATDENLELTLYNLAGKKVAETSVSLSSGGYQTIAINNVEHLTPGLYVIEISNGDQKGTRKLFKQ